MEHADGDVPARGGPRQLEHLGELEAAEGGYLPFLRITNSTRRFFA
jgi:hypothetical protein